MKLGFAGQVAVNHRDVEEKKVKSMAQEELEHGARERSVEKTDRSARAAGCRGGRDARPAPRNLPTNFPFRGS